eukprot:scaffold30612_cov129-Isochrysis_galbana.AAC.1
MEWAGEEKRGTKGEASHVENGNLLRGVPRLSDLMQRVPRTYERIFSGDLLYAGGGGNQRMSNKLARCAASRVRMRRLQSAVVRRRCGRACGAVVSHDLFLRCALHFDWLAETLLASGDSAGHPGPKTLLLSLPFPIISPSLFLIQATFSGGMVQKLRALQQPEV